MTGSDCWLWSMIVGGLTDYLILQGPSTNISLGLYWMIPVSVIEPGSLDWKFVSQIIEKVFYLTYACGTKCKLRHLYIRPQAEFGLYFGVSLSLVTFHLSETGDVFNGSALTGVLPQSFDWTYPDQTRNGNISHACSKSVRLSSEDSSNSDLVGSKFQHF